MVVNARASGRYLSGGNMKKWAGLILGLIVLGSGIFAGCSHSQVLKKQTKPSLLFVQTTESGSLVPNKELPGLYKLTFNQINPSTVYFTDRPFRNVGHQTTTEFIQDWSEGPHSFEMVPPNAALEILDATLGNLTIIVELLNPKLSSDGKNLTYDVRVLNAPPISSEFIKGKLTGDVSNKAPKGAIGKFGIAALFIDSSTPAQGHCLTVKNQVIPSKNVKWEKNVRSCSSKAWGRKPGTIQCLKKKYSKIPEQCIDCYGEMAACARSKCWSHCMFSSTSESCLKCALNKCEDPNNHKGFSLVRCTGLTAKELKTDG